MNRTTYSLEPIGVIRSSLRDAQAAPKQGTEGAPSAWIELEARYIGALDGLVVGDPLVLLTWLHEAQRDLLQVHPRDDLRAPLKGCSPRARRIDPIPSASIP